MCIQESHSGTMVAKDRVLYSQDMIKIKNISNELQMSCYPNPRHSILIYSTYHNEQILEKITKW